MSDKAHSLPRSIQKSPMVTFTLNGSPPKTPRRSRVLSYEVDGCIPFGDISPFPTYGTPKKQSSASPRRASGITSPRFSPYARKTKSPADSMRLKESRRGYLKTWGIERNMEEVEDKLGSLTLKGCAAAAKISFAEPGWASPDVDYEKKWHILVLTEGEPAGGYSACITFADFPWPVANPNFEPVSVGKFPEFLESMEAFLYHPARLARRKLTNESLEDEERFRWDPRAIADRVLDKVIPRDREAVREAAALVVARLYGLPEEDIFVSGAKARLALISERMAHSQGQSSRKTVGFEAFVQSLPKGRLEQRLTHLEVPKSTEVLEAFCSIDDTFFTASGSEFIMTTDETDCSSDEY